MTRQATKAFTETRGARFADARREAAAQRAAQVAAGTRREMVVVAVADVRDDDEVTTTKGGGWFPASEVDRADWATSDGQTAVMRFRTT